ncbi:hypothetical protein [Gryllotalpicola koreensis]|uniref:DUF3558 domain-containing protein n=1 Tax=Gryllotalpicola koreensis TaxID=993086 RepID=A0ABP7ZX04_9MICO
MSVGAPPHRRRQRTLWIAGGVAAALAVAGLLSTGRLNADLVPQPAAKPAPHTVDCYGVDAAPDYSWDAGVTERTGSDVPRVDPVVVCAALIRNAEAVEQLDQLARQQQVLGRDCVVFATSDGGSWALTGLQSVDKTYTASGGPAPGKLPGFGVVSQPAPLASLAPVPAPTAGCVRLSTVTWRLPVPPLAACTVDGTAVSVYQRALAQTARELCSAKGLVVAEE